MEVPQIFMMYVIMEIGHTTYNGYMGCFQNYTRHGQQKPNKAEQTTVSTESSRDLHKLRLQYYLTFPLMCSILNTILFYSHQTLPDVSGIEVLLEVGYRGVLIQVVVLVACDQFQSEISSPRYMLRISRMPK